LYYSIYNKKKMFPRINLKFLTLTALLANSVVADKAKIYRNCLKPGQFVLTCKI